MDCALCSDARGHGRGESARYGGRRLDGGLGGGRGVGHRNPANRRMRRAPIPRARLPDLFLSRANFRHLLSDGFTGAAANPLGVVPVVTVGPTGVAGAGFVMIAGGGADRKSTRLNSSPYCPFLFPFFSFIH